MHLKMQSAVSQLIIVDIQTKLALAMQQNGMQKLVKNTANLLQAAKLLSVPPIITEQYPQGLGETLAELKAYHSPAKIISKTAFSACAEPTFSQQLHRDKSQIILAGMEAHICVLQTALDLISINKQVIVVEDAIISRDAANKANAVARMRDAGCIITNTESVLFEWLGNASHEAFKPISKLIR